jgi:hypothetical protein
MLCGCVRPAARIGEVDRADRPLAADRVHHAHSREQPLGGAALLRAKAVYC